MFCLLSILKVYTQIIQFCFNLGLSAEYLRKNMCICTGMSENRAIQIPIKKNGSVIYSFLRKRGLVVYLAALKKGTIRAAHQ